jgi:hypothetical protein
MIFLNPVVISSTNMMDGSNITAIYCRIPKLWAKCAPLKGRLLRLSILIYVSALTVPVRKCFGIIFRNPLLEN